MNLRSRRQTRATLLYAAFLSPLLLVSSSSSFDPYESNGGLISAVAGNGFCILAADTRMTGPGYLIHSRNHIASRLWTVTDDPLMEQVEELLRTDSNSKRKQETSNDNATKSPYKVLERHRVPWSKVPVWIGSAGCTTDCQALKSHIRADLRASNHFGQIDRNQPDQVATCLSQQLYQRRHFPYYAFCVAAGLDIQSQHGSVYVYDAVGSYEQVAVAATGTGRECLQPILDRMFLSTLSSSSSSSLSTTEDHPRVVQGSASEAIRKLCQAYRSVSEREIEVGDKLILYVSEINKDEGDVSCRILVVPLKED